MRIQSKQFSSLLVYFSLVLFFYQKPFAKSPLPPENHLVGSAAGLEMIWVDVHEGGQPITYIKGSPDSEIGRQEDENQHLVTLTKGFYLGKYEVKQAEFEAVLRANNPDNHDPTPSGFPAPQQPVRNISWDDAIYFIDRLNELERKKGNLPKGWAYTLPSEAEWEYACRSETNSSYFFGDSLDINQSNFRFNQSSPNQPLNVGSYEKNDFGFYDMHGNVSEWCIDWYVKDLNGSFSDPAGPVYAKGPTSLLDDDQMYYRDPQNPNNPIFPLKVCRGGSFNDPAPEIRSARRFPTPRDKKLIHIGFRLALKKIQSSYNLEYATTGSAVSSMFSAPYEIESSWEDVGELPVYSISNQDLQSLVLDEGFANVLNFSDPYLDVTFKRVESDASAEAYFDIFLSSFNVDTDLWEFRWSRDSISESNVVDWVKQLSNYPSPAGYARYHNSNISSNYEGQSMNGAMVSLRNEYLSATYTDFVEQGIDMGNGWKWAKWFGYYYGGQFPWIFHENLGWTYISQTQSDNAWIFRDHLGWGWTSAPDWWFEQNSTIYQQAAQTPSFPYIYRHGYDENDTKVWTFLNPASSQTILYDFQENDWFALDQPVDINGSIVPQLGGTVSGYGQYHRWEKVTLSVEPTDNYNFLYWGNNEDQSTTYEFFATKSRNMHASFSPKLSGGKFPHNADQLFSEILSVRNDLDDIEKSRALFEFLFTGKSPTAGVQ